MLTITYLHRESVQCVIYWCMFVYVCVCVYIYIYIYIYMCVCVCVCVCVNTHTYTLVKYSLPSDSHYLKKETYNTHFSSKAGIRDRRVYRSMSETTVSCKVQARIFQYNCNCIQPNFGQNPCIQIIITGANECDFKHQLLMAPNVVVGRWQCLCVQVYWTHRHI
jgi:hypothetical protein